MKHLSFIICLILNAFFSCSVTAQTKSIAQATTITLYIHGTKLPGVDIKREFFGGLIPQGLQCATELTQSNHPHDIITAFCTGTHTLTSKHTLYFFGWDGLFPTQREQEAQKLFAALMELITKDAIQQLHIRCITHSHGGNIALYLIHLIDTHKAPIIIDELILMGCPIQEMTEKYAHSATIKKIYNLYSNGDEIQQNDPQGLYPEAHQNGERPPLRSARIFTKKRDHLWEVALRMNGKKIGHQDFIDHLFLLSLAQVIAQANKHEAGNLHINLVTNKQQKPIEHINLTIQR